jgi:putative restriction endonuclease
MSTGGKLFDLTDPAAVTSAMAEFRRMGRDAFIKSYGVPEKKFGRSHDHFVVEDGIGYDSKPLAAAAYGFQHGRKHALHADDFHGGDPTIARFEALGFRMAHWTSPRLTEGDIYTLKDLRATFGVTDKTLETGVYRPRDTHSIWLFVTKDKAKDRTPYAVRFEGDILYWQGQTKGRTDAAIINHEAAGDELLVFYREDVRKHPGAGFRYEGRFRHVRHSGSAPTSFVLQRWTTNEDVEVGQPEFDPDSIEDGRKLIWQQLKRRQGQGGFRRRLLKAYEGCCAITACNVEPLLEAAHIRSYFGDETNVVHNGLLLRADIHSLFDLGLISIADDHSILVAERLASTDYAKLAKTSLRDPTVAAHAPSPAALRWHRKEHGWEPG